MLLFGARRCVALPLRSGELFAALLLFGGCVYLLQSRWIRKESLHERKITERGQPVEQLQTSSRGGGAGPVAPPLEKSRSEQDASTTTTGASITEQTTVEIIVDFVELIADKNNLTVPTVPRACSDLPKDSLGIPAKSSGKLIWESQPCQSPTSHGAGGCTGGGEVVACSGGEVVCGGTDITCMGENIFCEDGEEMESYVNDTLVYASRMVCSGHQMMCRGHGVRCSMKPPSGDETLACAVTDGRLKPTRTPTPVMFRDVFPDSGKENFFFLETSSTAFVSLRVLYVLESFSRMNPKTTVWFLHTACTLRSKTTYRIDILKEAYSNFKTAVLNIKTLTDDTPLAELYASDELWSSKFLVNNLSDMSRLAVLYKAGGAYFDSDIYAWRPVTDPSNFAAYEDDTYVANAALHFQKNHPFLEAYMNHLTQNFDGGLWGMNGPKALTRVLEDHDCFNVIEDAGHDPSGNSSVCSLHIVPYDVFYAIPYWNTDLLFRPIAEQTTNEVLFDQNEDLDENDKASLISKVFPSSLGIHVSNHQTKGNKIGSDSLLMDIARVVSPVMTKLYPLAQ